MRPSPRLLVLAAAALLLVGCTPAASAPEPGPSSPVAVAPTPDPDEVEAAVNDLYARYLAVFADIARGDYDSGEVLEVMSGQAVTSAEMYRDHVEERGGTFEGSVVPDGMRLESVDTSNGFAIVLVACEDWGGVLITPENEDPYVPLAPSHRNVGRLTIDGPSLADLRVTSENEAGEGTEC